MVQKKTDYKELAARYAALVREAKAKTDEANKLKTVLTDYAAILGQQQIDLDAVLIERRMRDTATFDKKKMTLSTIDYLWVKTDGKMIEVKLHPEAVDGCRLPEELEEVLASIDYRLETAVTYAVRVKN